MHMVVIENLSINNILNNISCTVPAGRITTFIGPSGVGKTTLLQTIAQLNNKQHTGQITIDGTNESTLSPQKRAQLIGFVFQDFNLFSHLTVLENCAQPLQVVLKKSPKIAQQHALLILSHLGMEKYAQRYPSQLSGGQQQRVAIARALCLGPKTLLLDEPTSALDPENTNTLITLLQKLKQQNIAIGISSQDTAFIKIIMDRLYLLKTKKIVAEFDSMHNTHVPKEISLFLP